MRWLTIGILCALGAACGGGGSADAETRPRWVVLGSSTAAGVGASPGNGWAAKLGVNAGSRGATLSNLARSGAVTYEALPASAPRPAGRPATDPAMDVSTVLSTRPRLLLLAFPSNDAMRGFTADETASNLLAMRSLAQAAGAAVLVLSSQPRDDASDVQRAAMAAVDGALAAATGACFVDVRAALTAPNGGIAAGLGAGDGVHLNDAGHDIVFRQVVSALDGGACVRLAAS